MGELVPLVESYGVNVRMNKPTTVVKNVYTTSIGTSGGETLESKAGGTDVLCKCVIHFN